MSDSTSYVVGHYCAPNDRNGNPRRVFVLYQIESRRGLWFKIAADEGYNGDDRATVLRLLSPEIPQGARVFWLPRVNVTGPEYRRILNGSPRLPLVAVFDAHGRRVAEVYDDADRALVRSAPDLLAACKAVVAIGDCDDTNSIDLRATVDTMRLLRAALAKAEGRQA